jgi:GT2 family glycosyltransferase
MSKDNNMKNKFSVGLLTYNNTTRFRECISYIPTLDTIPFIVLNDGTPYDSKEYRDDMIVIQNHKNKKIAKSKNHLLKYLLTFDTDWIFIMEDDMKIKDSHVFNRYIEVANDSGILHLNYALHGNDNWNTDRTSPSPRLTYTNGISLYECAGGCFQMYHRSVIEKIGMYDEFYKNSWEHLDMTYRATLSGFHTPYWLAADIINSHEFIEQMDYQIESTISSNKHNPFYYEGLYYWKFKFGSWVADIPDWINEKYHTDEIINMFYYRKYDELASLFFDYYKKNTCLYFNKDYKEGHVFDNVWGFVRDNKPTLYTQ